MSAVIETAEGLAQQAVAGVDKLQGKDFFKKHKSNEAEQLGRAACESPVLVGEGGRRGSATNETK